MNLVLLQRLGVADPSGPVSAGGQCRHGVVAVAEHRLLLRVGVVLGLVPEPAGGLPEKLQEANVRRVGGEDPPDHQAAQQPRGQAVRLLLHLRRQLLEALMLLLLQGRDEHLEERQQVTEERHTDRRVEVQRRREQRLDEERDAPPVGQPGHDVQQRRRPHDRVDQEGDRRATDEQVVDEVLDHAHFAHRRERLARLHQEGEQEALEPPTPLPRRLREGVGRGLVGDEVAHLDGVAAALEAHGQVGVLGDVPGVPDPRDSDLLAVDDVNILPVLLGDLPEGGRQEVVAGATERRDESQPREAREHPPEVDDVLGPVERADSSEPRVHELEHALDARDGLVTQPPVVHRCHCLEQLHQDGLVLEIVDREAFPGHEVHGVVTRLRLGGRGARNRGVLDQPHVARQLPPVHDVDGGLVVLVDDEQDLEQLRRILDPRQPVQQAAETFGRLVPHGDEQAVGRQVRVVDARDLDGRELVARARDGHRRLHDEERHVERGGQRHEEAKERLRAGPDQRQAVQERRQEQTSEEELLTPSEEDRRGLLFATRVRQKSPCGVKRHVGQPFRKIW
jgi:hypothetical protein